MERQICRRVVTVFTAAVGVSSFVFVGKPACAQAVAAPQLLAPTKVTRMEKRTARALALAAQRYIRINRMLAQLNLTAEQRTRINSLQLDAQRQIAALILNTSLTALTRKEQIHTIAIHAFSQTRSNLHALQKQKLRQLMDQDRLAQQGGDSVSGVLTNGSAAAVTADGEEIQF